MKTIYVQASKNYNVLIGENLLEQLAENLQPILNKSSKIAIISDSNVWPIYGSIVENHLLASGFTTIHFTFPAGENSKNMGTYRDILNFLSENHISRADALLALGGGVVGDITGFAAATYLRGIAYIHVPTTLLAMVDSSVGGKTAIDLPAGKNLVGAFYQPSLVLCDLSVLKTLPESIFCDGCAEVIKYGVLFDSQLFSHLAEQGLHFDKEYVVSRCVELKRDVVTQDEFDVCNRQKLNLGHTIGHGIEACSQFSVTHGQAVAIGMAIVAKAGCKKIYNELTEVLKEFHLPVTTDYTVQQLFSCALSDKKSNGEQVNLIIPRAIGDCEIVPTNFSELESFIQEGL